MLRLKRFLGSRSGSRKNYPPPSQRFEKFTERARRVLALAQEEARRFNHDYLGTEHLLLGLLRETDSLAGKVLFKFGVGLEEARRQVEAIVGQGQADSGGAGVISLTPRSKKVLELAVEEARLLNHDYIGTEHLLLALLREGEGIAADILKQMGLSLPKAKQEILTLLNQNNP